MSILAMVSFSPFSAAISSSTGATILHGPHQVAQKSTRTGFSLVRTSSTNVSSVTFTVLAMASPSGWSQASMDPTVQSSGCVGPVLTKEERTRADRASGGIARVRRTSLHPHVQVRFTWCPSFASQGAEGRAVPQQAKYHKNPEAVSRLNPDQYRVTQ